MTAPPHVTPQALTLVNAWQHDWPLVLQPYAAVAASLGWSQAQVLDTLRALDAQGMLSRVGPVFEHRRAGASALVAMKVPPERLEAVAAHVNTWSEVNHNYQREHDWNLWFVVTAVDQARVDAVLAGIAQASGIVPLPLPMLRPFHIDLGFALALNAEGQVVVDTTTARQSRQPAPPCAQVMAAAPLSPALQTALRRWLEDGLPLVAQPWQVFAERHGLTPEQVLAQVQQWQEQGLFRRFGIVVRHHALGIRANLMLVMDIPDARVPALGTALAAVPGVTLCYWRQRHLPQWPYNLYCMMHGHDRSAVEQAARRMLETHGLCAVPHQFLFSLRAFKQRGARYVPRSSAPAVPAEVTA